MSVLHVHRSLPAVVQLLHVRINSTFVQNENVLAQVPSVHGRSVARVATSSTPAALLCAAWELGHRGPTLNPRSAKQAAAL